MFAPNSTIRLMKGVPLDSTYRNTIWFDNAGEQFEHFTNEYEYKLFSDQTYQRYARGTLRISALADELYDYNYLAFRNNVNGAKGKIFYCFINSVEYIAERTTEIKYEIDYMQTYFFDYDLGDSFVEREHSATDEIGENLIPENLELGEYICSPTNNSDNLITELLPLNICVAATVKNVDGDVEDTDGQIYNGLYSGVALNVFSMDGDGIEAYKEFMSKLTKEAKSEGVTSVFCIPKVLSTERGTDISAPIVYKHTISVPDDYGILRTNGNNVKNKKLYTFPYTFLYVTNLQGTGVAYPFEYFEWKPGTLTDKSVEFNFSGDFSPMCNVLFYPIDYKGIHNNYDEKIELSGYPQLAFNIDTYKAYVAQNAGKIAASTVNNVASVASNFNMGHLYSSANSIDGGGLINSLGNVLNSIGSMRDKMVMPNQAKGGVNTSLAMLARRIFTFQYLHKHIRPEFVDIIDDYFSMYGYATHLVKKPNRNVRKNWTFVKTKGCIIISKECPSMAIKAICNIYDNGITFWNKSAVIGDYTQDNDVLDFVIPPLE